MNSDFIPDYKNYTTFELFEIYRRIDRLNHSKRLKAIEYEIKRRMKIPIEKDLSNEININELDSIYERHFAKEKRKRLIKKESKILYWITTISLIGGILIFHSGFIAHNLGEHPLINKIIIGILILGLTYGLASSVIKEQFQTDKIKIKKEENPKLYLYTIIMSSLLIILLLLSIINYIQM